MAYAPLIQVTDITNKPMVDAIKALSGAQQTELVANASMAVEDYCRRRLAAFTGLVEHHRAQEVDPDAATDYPPSMLDNQAQINMLRAQSLGATSWVRTCRVDEYPPRFPDYWSGAIASVSITRDISGSTTITPAQIAEYQQDTGFVRFPIGAYIPIGSSIQVTYSGGYVTVPGGLKQAVIFEAIELAMLDILPELSNHFDMAELKDKKQELLTEYVRRDD